MDNADYGTLQCNARSAHENTGAHGIRFRRVLPSRTVPNSLYSPTSFMKYAHAIAPTVNPFNIPPRLADGTYSPHHHLSVPLLERRSASTIHVLSPCLASRFDLEKRTQPKRRKGAAKPRITAHPHLTNISQCPGPRRRPDISCHSPYTDVFYVVKRT